VATAMPGRAEHEYECAEHRRWGRGRVVFSPTFIHWRRVPIDLVDDHVNWMPLGRKPGEQNFVAFGDSARAHAALKLLRACDLVHNLFAPQRVESPIRRAPLRRDKADRSAGAVPGRTVVVDAGPAPTKARPRTAERDEAPAGPIRVCVNCHPSIWARLGNPMARMTRFGFGGC
jgi:hypothetical protein